MLRVIITIATVGQSEEVYVVGIPSIKWFSYLDKTRFHLPHARTVTATANLLPPFALSVLSLLVVML